MEDIKYIEKIIKVKFEGLEKFLDDKFANNDVMHADMISEAKKTNSRIKKLELWRSALLGGFVVITLFILPIVVNFISNFLNNR